MARAETPQARKRRARGWTACLLPRGRLDESTRRAECATPRRLCPDARDARDRTPRARLRTRALRRRCARCATRRSAVSARRRRQENIIASASCRDRRGRETSPSDSVSPPSPGTRAHFAGRVRDEAKTRDRFCVTIRIDRERRATAPGDPEWPPGDPPPWSGFLLSGSRHAPRPPLRKRLRRGRGGPRRARRRRHEPRDADAIASYPRSPPRGGANIPRGPGRRAHLPRLRQALRRPCHHRLRTLLLATMPLHVDGAHGPRTELSHVPRAAVPREPPSMARQHHPGGPRRALPRRRARRRARPSPATASTSATAGDRARDPRRASSRSSSSTPSPPGRRSR